MPFLRRLVTSVLATYFLFSPIAQAIPRVEGRVLDKVTKQGIPWSNILFVYTPEQGQPLDSSWTPTDSTGNFSWNPPSDSIDSLLVQASSTGYQTEKKIIPYTTSPIEIILESMVTDVGNVLVTAGTFHRIKNEQPEHTASLDKDMNYKIGQEYSSFTLNELSRIIEQAPTVERQSDVSAAITIAGIRAPTTINGIQLLRDDRLEVLGLSPYTFSSVTIHETHNKVGFPGSIEIMPRISPRPDTNNIVVNIHPVLKEAFIEKQKGSVYGFADLFFSDNVFLEKTGQEIRAPGYIGGEALVHLDTVICKDLTAHYIFSQGDVDSETNKSGISTTTTDHALLVSGSAQPTSLFGNGYYPILTGKLAYQDSRLHILNPDSTINLSFNRSRFDAIAELKFIENWGILFGEIGYEKNIVQLAGDLSATTVGDGGAQFSQTIRNLANTVQEDHTYLYIGLQKGNYTLHLKQDFINDKTATSVWTDISGKTVSVPWKLSGGLVQRYLSDIDAIDNRLIVSASENIKQEQVVFITGKTGKQFDFGLRLEAGGYWNGTRTNHAREPDSYDLAQTLEQELNQEGADTTAIIQDWIAHPYDHVPPSNNHLLKGQRKGFWLQGVFGKGPLVLQGKLSWEYAFTEIPEGNYFHTIRDTTNNVDLNNSGFVNYTGKKITHPTSKGFQARMRAIYNLQEQVGIPFSLDVLVQLKEGKPFSPPLLTPLTLATDSGYVHITNDGKPLYLKQDKPFDQAQFPWNLNMDLAITWQPKSNLAIKAYGENLLGQSSIERVYQEEYLVLSNGSFWDNQDNIRIFGVSLEWKTSW